MTSKEGISVLGFGREGEKELGQEGKVEIINDLKLSSVILVFFYSTIDFHASDCDI